MFRSITGIVVLSLGLVVAATAAPGQGFPDNLARQDTALAALARHPEAAMDFTQGTGAVLDCCADLGVGDALAETDVHWSWIPVAVDYDVENFNANENDFYLDF